MSVAIILFPGTNCEFDTRYAYEALGADVQIVWHKDKLPKATSLVVIPGGFSYGDYLRCGAIAQFSSIMRDIKSFASGGGNVLGICNGFQILCEAGLLPGALRRNEKLHFIAKTQKLRVVSNKNTFLSSYQPLQEIHIPIAHADGNYFIDDAGLQNLRANDQILLEYVDNPNGSVGSVAGICNKHKNVFGLMPHPERAVNELQGSIDGISMLANLLR